MFNDKRWKLKIFKLDIQNKIEPGKIKIEIGIRKIKVRYPTIYSFNFKLYVAIYILNIQYL